MEFQPTNAAGPFGTATEYRIARGPTVAYLGKRADGRWWLEFGGREQRLGRKASFPSAQKALIGMGW